MNCPSYNMFFETVSTKIRMDIMCLLRKKSMPVSEICSALGEEQSKVSHNLKKLSDCRIVEYKKKGKQRIYSLNKETIVPMLELVENHVNNCCGAVCMRR